jgi:thiol-disulfide isomerase/thioredoxin
MKRVFTHVFALVLVALLIQSMTFSQATKKVLIEDFTSSTCGPCASFNPGFHTWLEAHRDNLSIISFHMNWPAPGTDPMFMANQTENTARRNYYGVNSIPQFWMEGTHQWISSLSNIDVWYGVYMAQTTPVAISVVDTRVAPDSIVTNVTVTNLTSLPSGNYTLKVYAVERDIYIVSDPGLTNGEHDFPDVFRKALTPIGGTTVSSAAGTYNFQYRFKRDANWVDAQMYTVAFVQNDNDKSLKNTKSSNFDYLIGIDPYTNEVPSGYSLSQNYPNPFNPTTNIQFDLPKTQQVSLKLYDMLGNEVQNLVEGIQQAGKYNITVDGSKLSSGVYFYSLKTADFSDTKKMTLIK